MARGPVWGLARVTALAREPEAVRAKETASVKARVLALALAPAREAAPAEVVEVEVEEVAAAGWAPARAG
jgi:hypothetical protein